MTKSRNRKIEDMKNRKPDTSKRDNPNRGKNGCHRLHEMKAKKEQDHMIQSTPKEKITTIEQNNLSFTSKLKGKISKLWK